MKKLLVLMMVLAVAVLAAGCKQSNITAEEIDGIEVEETGRETLAPPTTVEYTIPEGATGPADVQIETNADDIPEGFRTEDTGDAMQVRYFYVNSSGLHEDFDVIEGASECTPEALVEILVKDGVLGEGTEVGSFESDGENATLVLNYLVACSPHATMEQLAQAVANTFIDNLYLETITIKESEGESYGPLEYQG